MSDFDDFMAEAFGEAREVFGEERFTIEGKPFTEARAVRGSWNELGSEEQLTLNGRTITINAMLQIAASEFGRLGPRQGQIVTRQKDGRRFRIVGEIHRDTLTFTFPLETIHQ